MKLLSTVAAVCLAGVAAAQQSLIINPVSAMPGFVLTYSVAGANFYDITVSQTITLQALRIGNFSPAGTQGTLDFYMTNGTTPALQTHVGNEQIAANWTLMSSGPYNSAGVVSLNTSCQTPGVVIQPGTYGICIKCNTILTEWTGVATFQTFSNAGEITVFNGTTQVGPAAFTGAPQAPFVFNGVNYIGAQSRLTLFYALGAVPHACAATDSFGAGSVKRLASAYQYFEDAAPSSAALTGNYIVFQPNQTFDGYVVTQTPSTPPTFVMPTGGAVPLALMDDSQVLINPVSPVFYFDETGAFQMTNDLYVHSNGYVSLAMQQSTLPDAPIDIQAAMNANATAFYSYHDYNPTEVGSGQVVWEEIGGTLYVTWMGVESYPDLVANPSTFQFQFTPGEVRIVWQSMTTTGGSPFFGGDDHLVGFSPAGVSPRVDPFDITMIAATPVTLRAPEIFPLTLQFTGTALLGGSFSLDTSNLVGSPSIGVNLVSPVLSFPPPGVALSVFGAPMGTNAYLDVGQSILNVIDNSGVIGPPVMIPTTPSLAGALFYSQSFWWSNIGTFLGGNLFGDLLSSNGVRITLGVF